MFDFIAYTPPNIIIDMFDAPFVIKKENNNYLLYISKAPINYEFIYNNDTSKLLYIKIEKESHIYNEIECAFNISRYSDIALNSSQSLLRNSFYSYNGKYLQSINYNDCLIKVKSYVKVIYNKTFPEYDIFQ